ncbi:integrin alpha-M-like, partial [Heterodontus francisci]|uniref:integrin alpha-M-like n=1 Tax=Heterodontus francisci TaxID=7792 RepID=UPI00355B00A4
VGPEFQSPKGRRELEIIASNSTNHTVFFIENYDALSTIQDKLQAKIFAIEGTKGTPNMTSFQKEMSQEGFSSILTSDTVVLGTVGGYDWSGGILLYQGDKEVFFNISTSDPDIRNSYLGYSVQEATRAGIVSYVVGAPRYRHRGEVIVFRKGVNGSWEDVQRIPGEQIGSYFGSELCTLDLNGDGETDLLLIGAPLYHNQRVGGIVIICSLSPEGNFSCRGTLRGGEGNGLGRFGSSIAALRDLNGDGIGDVAIGAPLEDEHRGSVYIYHGERSGINPRYSQRIQGAEYSPALRYFGQAVSGTMDVNGDTLTDLVVGALGTVTVFRSRPVLNVSVTVAFHPRRIPHKAYECRRQLSLNQPISKATVCFEMAKLLPDKLGELKANFTFTMLLDMGRQQSRATFWTLSRRLTDSLQLDSMKRCQEHVMVLPSCVKDYFKPVELVLNFTVDGEEIPGTNGLRPILDEYSNTTHSYQLPFERDCGWDNECMDYLRVFFNFSGGDTVVVRRDAVLTAVVVLENAHEDSYKTQLIVDHPARLSFKKISAVQPSSVYIECGDLQYHSWIERTTLRCSVNHPVFAKASRVTFKANFDLSTSGAEKQNGSFNIRATSQNTLRITNESTFVRTILLRYAVNLAASGAGYTRDVNFTAGRQDTRLVKHSYQVENLGHRSLPITVTFTVPAWIGARLLWNVSVSEREPGNRSVCLPPVESVAPMEGEKRKEPEDQIRLDCGIALCVVLQCSVAALEDHGKVIFDLQGELMSAAVAELRAKKLQLPSKVRVSYDGEKYVDVLDPTGQYKEATVMTEVDIFEPVSRLPMIVGGSIAGLVLLLILMVVFYKLGFFKRKNSSRDRDSLRGNTSESGEGPSAERENRQE